MNSSILVRPSFLNSRLWRLTSLLVLGFASGLPLALTGQAMQAWLTTAGMTMAAIGMFSLVTQPYAYKFIWAPLMNRFEPPFFGRRRCWLVLTQLFLAGSIALMSRINPAEQTYLFAGLALLVAFFSSSQDIVIDAYRTDISPSEERGLAASVGVFGYRLAMIVSGGIAFILADSIGWSQVYQYMALIMLAMAVFSLFTPLIPQEQSDAQKGRDFMLFMMVVLAAVLSFVALYRGFRWAVPQLSGTWGFIPVVASLLLSLTLVNALSRWTRFSGQKDVNGFMYMLLGVVLGVFVGQAIFYVLNPIVQSWFAGMSAANAGKWINLIETLVILSVTIPAAYFGAKWSKFELLLEPLGEYFSRDAAWWFLGLLVFYKLGDAFAGTLSTAFLLKGAAFTQTEVGLVNKMLGMFATIGGVFLGGVLMLRLGLFRSLLLFGVLQALSNMGFWLLAEFGKDAWGHFNLPTGEVARFLTGNDQLTGDTPIDLLLVFVVCFENITGGMGTAAFVALLMALSRGGHSLTYYALLSALASLGRIYVGPVAGVLAEPENLGWSKFFIFATVMALPGLLLLWHMRQRIKQLA